jgi:hypothetical protein
MVPASWFLVSDEWGMWWGPRTCAYPGGPKGEPGWRWGARLLAGPQLALSLFAPPRRVRTRRHGCHSESADVSAGSRFRMTGLSWSEQLGSGAAWASVQK